MRGLRRHYGARHGRHRHAGRIILAVVAMAGLLLSMAVRCRPVVTAFAESQAIWLATKITNETVSQILEQQTEVCRSIIQTSYNDRQVLSSLVTDTVAINTVKTAVTAAVIEKMEDISSVTVGIPLGTLIGLDWLSGWGPPVSFSMSVTSSVMSAVSTVLEEAGINQSNYRVLLQVDISLYVVTPGGRSTVCSSQTYSMAEAVLIGDVPDNLTEVYGDDQDTIGEIFDYGTVND